MGAEDPDREGWVSIVHRRLPAGTVFQRLGVVRSTVADALAVQVPLAEAARPRLITVWLVVNDFRYDVPLEIYRTQLRELVGRCVATGAAVFVGNMPELTGLAEFSDRPPEELLAQTAAWNRTIAQVVAEEGAVLVDLFAASQELEGGSVSLVADDGFHPSTIGHLVLAEIFIHYIEIASPFSQPQ